MSYYDYQHSLQVGKRAGFTGQLYTYHIDDSIQCLTGLFGMISSLNYYTEEEMLINSLLEKVGKVQDGGNSADYVVRKVVTKVYQHLVTKTGITV